MDVVRGRVYVLAGLGPMKLLEINDDSTCLYFEQTSGRDYTARPSAVVREPDVAWLTAHVSQLQSRGLFVGKVQLWIEQLEERLRKACFRGAAKTVKS